MQRCASIFRRVIFSIAVVAVIFHLYKSSLVIVQSSRCPFHSRTPSVDANLNAARQSIYRKRRLSDVKSIESPATVQPMSLYSFVLSLLPTRWIVDRFRWSTNTISEGPSCIGNKGQQKDRPLWNDSRLVQLESNWNEANQDWQTKLNRVWTELKSSPSISNCYPSVLAFMFRLILLGDDFTRLRFPLTFRPYSNTQKVLHSAGSYGRVLFRWTDTEFRSSHTGIFSEPTAEAIMSASVGNVFVGNQSAVFGYGFKFFRTNTSSATILSLNAFFGLGAYWNAFGYMSCNHASLAEMSVLIPTLPGWSKFPNQNGLSNVAAYTLNGEPARQPRFPYALCFVPNPQLTERMGQPSTLSPLSALQSQFKLVRPGERLFNVVAIFHPVVLSRPELLQFTQFCRHVGEVVALTPFTLSQYGDSRLFFQHQPFDEDLLLRPDWIPHMTLKNLINEGALAAYSRLYVPPTPGLYDQIVAIQSLAQFLIRLFTYPSSVQAWRLLGLSGSPSSLLIDLVFHPYTQQMFQAPTAATGRTSPRRLGTLLSRWLSVVEVPQFSGRLNPSVNPFSWLIASEEEEEEERDGGEGDVPLPRLLSSLDSVRLEQFHRSSESHWGQQVQQTGKLTSTAAVDTHVPHSATTLRLLSDLHGDEAEDDGLLSEFNRMDRAETEKRRQALHDWHDALVAESRCSRSDDDCDHLMEEVLRQWFLSRRLNLLPSIMGSSNSSHRSEEGVDKREEQSIRDYRFNTPGFNPDDSHSSFTADAFHDALSFLFESRKAKNANQQRQPLMAMNPQQRGERSSSFGSPFKHLLTLDEHVVFLFLLDLSALLTTPLRSLLHHIDPKLMTIHLLGPLFFTLTKETPTRDALFERLQSVVLGVKAPATQ